MTVTTPDLATAWRGRLDRIVPTVFLVALAFVQQPGWTSADTKLDLYVNPGGFLNRAMSLWDPLAAGGQLQNQAYGYLFPMGPFFWLGHALGVPGWVVQRLWWALILVLAYHGVRLVLERLGIGTGWSRTIAAFSYALAPRMLIGLGAISSEIWPMAIAPWILLPLLAVERGHERQAALRSGGAILLLGAVNAVASLAALVLPLWWLLTRRGPARRVLLAWWAGAVVLATAWWIVPLVLLGRYSPPFLGWIEDARVTTANASVTEALRGTTQWIATIGGNQNPVWPSGWMVLTSRNVVLMGLFIALVGLLGLALAPRPWAVFARGGLLLGLLLVTAGHIGGVSGPLADPMANLLDGALAPFRNTHKFEVVVRLPLAIGVAHGLPLAVRWLERHRAPWPLLAPALVVLALVGQTAAPAFVGVGQRGQFLAVPQAWADASRWLGQHPDGGRTLVLPGGNSPARFWGEPHDEPLQVFATQPWIVRDGVPLGSGGTTRLLNQIEARVATGRGGPDLLALLRSLAITRVLLTGDHQRPSTRSTPPVVARAALVSSGARPLEAFGGIVGGSTNPAVASDWGLDRPLREVELFDVATARPIAPTGLVPTSSIVGLTGGPEGVGALAGATSAVLTADGDSSSAVGPGRFVASDTLQRREANFSNVTDPYGPLLSADEAYPAARAVHDWLPAPLVEDDGLAAHQTVRLDDGDARASSSSTLAAPAFGQARDLATDAWRAFDSDGDTGWRSAGYEPVGEWVQLSWQAPVQLPDTVVITWDPNVSADVAAVRVSTDAGVLRTPITSRDVGTGANAERYPTEVAVPGGASQSLRITIESVRDKRPTVRILDIGVGDLPRVQPWVEVPTGTPGPEVVSLAASSDDRPGCYPLASGVLACSPDRRRVGEEAATLRRVFTTTEARRYDVSGTAVARGTGADALLRRPDGVRVRASSRWLPEPAVSPELVVDGDPKTYWASNPRDATPSVTLSWPDERDVSGLSISVDPDAAGSRPTEVDVTIGGRTVHRALDRDGFIELPETSAKRVVIEVTDTTQQRSLTSSGLQPMPVVIGDIALVGDPWPRVASGDDAVIVPCGFGPSIQVNGGTVATTVSATRSQILTGGAATLRACDQMASSVGEQRVQALASGEFAVRSLVLDGRPSSAPEPAGPGVTVTRWGDSDRAVAIGEATTTPTVLTVRENANAGWAASVGDTTLAPVRVDGWAQGWVVPAGTSGEVRLVFTPQRAFTLSLLVGAALALALLAGILTTRNRQASSGSVLPEVAATSVTRALAVVALVALGGAAGLVAGGVALALGPARRSLRSVVLVGAAGLWLAVAIWQPWPAAGATNRGYLSGALALLLVGVATTWRQGWPTTRRARTSASPRLDGRLDKVPAESRHDHRGDQRDTDRLPEAAAEVTKPHHPARPQHEREVPEEQPVADGPQVGHHRQGEEP